jgi:hypothetical protein
MSALPAPDDDATPDGLPTVTASAALDDAVWFQRYPHRRFRMRDVRGAGDRDKDIAAHWFAAAYPELFAKSVRKGRKAAGGRR